MKRLVIICLVMSILVIHTPWAMAETIQVKSEVLKVDESQLIKLAAQEKFNNLMAVMKKLVQNNISTAKEKVELDRIDIIDFEYSVDNMLKIYYQLN